MIIALLCDTLTHSCKSCKSCLKPCLSAKGGVLARKVCVAYICFLCSASGENQLANPQRRTTVVIEVVGDGMGVFDPTHNQSFVLNATSALVFQHWDGQT